VLDAALAQNETQARAFWALRENHSEAQKREGPSIKHDISVSISKIPAFIPEGLAAMRGVLPDCRPVTFGHVGDGNLHFNCQAPAGWDKPRFMERADAISTAVYDLVVRYGGSISAEHGIGQLKVDELAHYRSKVELDTMRAIKRALDPLNLMNPGKVIRV
jgi:FAD/FMN-containing dehydrogenase